MTDLKDEEAVIVEVHFTGREMQDILDAAEERDETFTYVIRNAVLEDLFR